MDEIKVLTQLNKDHVQQSIDDHIKMAELLIENKRLKTELREIRLIKAICNGED